MTQRSIRARFLPHVVGDHAGPSANSFADGLRRVTTSIQNNHTTSYFHRYKSK
jgi:hypothetical protein